jgi:hypothetical protein
MSNFYGAIDEIAIGGVIRNYGIYQSHTFTSSGTFTLHRPATVDYLIVGSGGSGGTGGLLTGTNQRYPGGGGGAGEVHLGSTTLVAGTYTVQVGVAALGLYNSSPLKSSSFAGITAIAGGSGGNTGTDVQGNFFHGTDGGSGGGASQPFGNTADEGFAIGTGLGHDGRDSWNVSGVLGQGGGGAGSLPQLAHSSGQFGVGGESIINTYKTGNNNQYAHGGDGAGPGNTKYNWMPGSGGTANSVDLSPLIKGIGSSGEVVIRYIM